MRDATKPFFDFASRFFNGKLQFSNRSIQSPIELANASISRLICQIVNHLLAQDRLATGTLKNHTNQTVSLHLNKFVLVFSITEQGFLQAVSSSEQASLVADTRIFMHWSDLIESVKSIHSLSRKVRIEGDMGFAQALSASFAGLSWNAEADLANLVGDVPAVWIMQSLTRFGTNTKNVLENFRLGLRDYLVHEQSLSPAKNELMDFSGSLNDLRDHIARLEKRMQRLDEKGQTP